MTRVVALAGKGSVGKSSMAAAMLPSFVEAVGGRVLVVDADPHMSLCRLLRLTPTATLGSLRSRYEREFKTGRGLPVETPDREAFAEARMGQEALVETDRGFDFLGIGQWELEGSQCVPNRVLERALRAMMGRYDAVLIDNEAGIEHVGRYVEIPLDELVVVSTPDPLFADVAGQIVAAARRVGRTVGRVRLVLNQVLPEDRDEPELAELIQAWLDNDAIVGPILPASTALTRASRRGEGPERLPAGDLWREAVAGLGRELARG